VARLGDPRHLVTARAQRAARADIAVSLRTGARNITKYGCPTRQPLVPGNQDWHRPPRLWDGTTDGYFPDVFVDTGTNQATMGSC
jgi:hypothetical protein